MAAREIYAEQEIGIVALLSKGQTSDSKVTFVILIDGVEHERIDGSIVSDAGAPKGKAATCKYTTPIVPKDKANYTLTYFVVAKGEEYKNSDTIKAWPKTGKLEVVQNEDDTKAFPDFKFKVMQDGKQVGADYVTVGDPAIKEFKLNKLPFTLEHVDPYEIKSTEKKDGALRDLKVKGVLNFVAEFVKPKLPADKKIKQWVNLTTTSDGQDGNSGKVVVQLGVKDDRDDTGTTKADILGKAGMFVYVKVEFGATAGQEKSKRNSPKTEIIAGKNVSALTEVTAFKEYTCKVELALAGGVGELEICVGSAGGDTCKISIGSTTACAQDNLTFINWRRAYYELLAPDFFPLVDKVLADGRNVKDLPANMVAAATSLGNNMFTEFVIDDTQLFAEADAPAGTCLPRSFIGRATGPDNVYVLTDHTFGLLPTGAAFANAKAPLSVPLKLCDANLFADPADHNAPHTLQPKVNVAAAFIDLPPNIYWLPKSGFDGAETIRSLKWKADITHAASPKGKPAMDITLVNSVIDSGSKSKRVYDVKETQQNKTRQVTFSRIVGDVSSSVSSSEKRELKAWFLTLLNDKTALRRDGLKITITGDRKAGNATSRGDAIQAELNAILLAANEAEIATHPGLEDDGTTPRSGDLIFTLGTANVAVDLARSTQSKIAVNLPTTNPEDPGNFVGDASDTKCNVKITVKYTKHHSGMGLASGGEILTVINKDHPKSTVGIVVHELCHLMNLSAHNQAADAHAPGLPKRKKYNQAHNIAAYKAIGTNNGHTYTGKGHSGSHCAFGLSDADKTGLAEYDDAFDDATCIMFGSTDFNDATVGLRKLCPECLAFAKARDVSAL